MMKNASCFVTLFHVINYYCSSKEASNSNPPTCTVASPYFEHRNVMLCIRMRSKWLSQWHSEVIPSGVKHDLYGQWLYPSRATTFIISQFGSTLNHTRPLHFQ